MLIRDFPPLADAADPSIGAAAISFGAFVSSMGEAISDMKTPLFVCLVVAVDAGAKETKDCAGNRRPSTITTTTTREERTMDQMSADTSDVADQVQLHEDNVAATRGTKLFGTGR